ncbi:MAG: NfeD family protein [Sulfolobaceae archaeon]|jgi:membrane protein implicated in regulation of membrane protease activity|nr:NfeD family protein [Sulfolobaceae archaeon]
MVSHIAIPVIIIVVVILLLVLTGQYQNPIVAVPSLAIVGYISYRIFYVIWKTRGRNLYTYIGKIGKAVDDLVPGKEGYVIVEGEYWKAISDEYIAKDEEIIVVGMDNFKLIVKKYTRAKIKS